MKASIQPDTKALRVLVTGGGGFLGRAIIARLLARGCRVRSFTRRGYPDLQDMGVEVVQGELADAEQVQAAGRGCGLVFHTAARAGLWGSYASYYVPNVRGTEHVIAACLKEGVGRLVFTSSPSVVFSGRDMKGVDESAPYPRRYCSSYCATKARAERMVLAANGPRLRTIALRPHLIWGPGDPHILPRLIARARAGKLRIVGRGDNRVDTTYIDNAADAHLLAADALEHNPHAAGRAFFISQGDPVLLWGFVNRLLAAAGVPPVSASIPHAPAWTAGLLLELLYKILGRDDEPSMTRFAANQVAASHWFDISAARRELGYDPKVTVEEGLRRLHAWCAQGAGGQPGTTPLMP